MFWGTGDGGRGTGDGGRGTGGSSPLVFCLSSNEWVGPSRASQFCHIDRDDAADRFEIEELEFISRIRTLYILQIPAHFRYSLKSSLPYVSPCITLCIVFYFVPMYFVLLCMYGYTYALGGELENEGCWFSASRAPTHPFSGRQ